MKIITLSELGGRFPLNLTYGKTDGQTYGRTDISNYIVLSLLKIMFQSLNKKINKVAFFSLKRREGDHRPPPIPFLLSHQKIRG